VTNISVRRSKALTWARLLIGIEVRLMHTTYILRRRWYRLENNVKCYFICRLDWIVAMYDRQAGKCEDMWTGDLKLK